MSQGSTGYDSNYAIARIDLPEQHTHGWQVRLQRRSIKYAKFFSDSSFGGMQLAFENAVRYRDQLVLDLESESSGQVRVCTRSARNRSGVVGVSRISVTSATGAVYHFWQASWSPEPGKRCCVKFSIKRYGDNEAFELAVKARVEATNS